jgi:hypothetical protein
LKTATSQKYTSDLDRAEIGKEQSRALEKVEDLKFELMTATTQKEISDIDKEEMGKELAQKQRLTEEWQMLSKSGSQKIALQRMCKHRQWICWKLVTAKYK